MGTATATADGAAITASRRRNRGSGGVKFVRDGVWLVDVEVDRDPVTGRRRRISRTVEGTRRDAEIALSRLKVANHERRLPSVGTRARSVGEALEHYVSAVEAGQVELAPSTVRTTRSAVRTMSDVLLPDGRRFGDVRLSKVTWQDVEHMYAGMRRNGKGADWVRRCATVLTRALDLARKRGLIDTNPSKHASRPKATRSKPYSPTREDVRAVLKAVAATDPEVGAAALVLASTGMRRGEVMALRWCDLDEKAHEVHVAAAVSDGGRGIGLVRNATKQSDWRDVPLTEAALAAIEAQRDRLTERHGSAPKPVAFLFPAAAGPEVPMPPEGLTGRWAAARGASPITLLHLRHYAATSMLDAGESYRTVADILGNSEATLRLHYDGRTDVGKRKAIAALEL